MRCYPLPGSVIPVANFDFRWAFERGGAGGNRKAVINMSCGKDG